MAIDIEHLTPEQQKDYQMIELFFQDCLKLFVDRAGKYGSSWRELTPTSISDLIKMKTSRATKTGEPHDIANYAAMLAIKIGEQHD